mmetsp:Transcript_14315/g.50955  ORF Transcript_14315/g.50955 Transcript_14315/m.50955 type:complete len:343 (-) Transcript_14315:45-1073(-)
MGSKQSPRPQAASTAVLSMCMTTSMRFVQSSPPSAVARAHSRSVSQSSISARNRSKSPSSPTSIRRTASMSAHGVARGVPPVCSPTSVKPPRGFVSVSSLSPLNASVRMALMNAGVFWMPCSLNSALRLSLLRVSAAASSKSARATKAAYASTSIVPTLSTTAPAARETKVRRFVALLLCIEKPQASRPTSERISSPTPASLATRTQPYLAYHARRCPSPTSRSTTAAARSNAAAAPGSRCASRAKVPKTPRSASVSRCVELASRCEKLKISCSASGASNGNGHGSLVLIGPLIVPSAAPRMFGLFECRTHDEVCAKVSATRGKRETWVLDRAATLAAFDVR